MNSPRASLEAVASRSPTRSCCGGASYDDQTGAKSSHHSQAIDSWEISTDAAHVLADTAHVMVPELRAAYVQMDAIWKCMPPEFKLDAMDDGRWASEARDGILATLDHPTPTSLALLPAERGGFLSGDIREICTRLALWLGLLGLGYGLALTYLAEVLGAEADVGPRIEAAVARMASAERS